jgi:phenylacetate-coenzyme A ligase PaaK-like adenylate-forming protein
MPDFMKPFVRLRLLKAGDPGVMKELEEFKPNMVITTPSAVDAWVASGWQPDRKHLRQIIVTSENLTAVARQRIEAATGVTVLDTYGAGECLFLTNGCQRGLGSHINADWVVFENVDADGLPVPLGQVGQKVLITNLANRLQPLIRYELPDQVRLATEDCGCGNRLPRIEQIVGRASDLFWVAAAGKEKPLSPMALLQAFQFFPMIREWQATQIDSRRIHVKLELLPNAELDFGRVRNRLDQGLGRAGFKNGDMPRIDLETVPRLTPGRNGKFRRIIALPRHSVVSHN